MKHEEIARKNHKSGSNCAMSVYSAYADEMGILPSEAMRSAPRPRSEGGQCGAFLAGRKVLEQLRPDLTAEFERRFVALNGRTECSRLVAAHGELKKTCNDYVGDAAKLVEELLNNA